MQGHARLTPILTLFFTSLGTLLAQEDTLQISVAVVQSSLSIQAESAPFNLTTWDAEVIAGASQPSLDGLLESAPGVDARQRGPLGTQTDLSIRGGTFEQVALWVDGVRWSAPHTGHHLLNLPIDPEDITLLRVVRGGSGTLGSGGVTGGVIVETGPGKEDGQEASVEMGSHGWSRIRARLDWSQKQSRHRISLSRSATSGFRPNTDLQLQRIRYAGSWDRAWGALDLRLGAMASAFGAQDFYTANFPEQFESVGLLQGQLTWKSNAGNWAMSAGLQHRHHRDRFELFREGEGYHVPDSAGVLTSDTGPVPSWYAGPNLHRSTTSGVRFSARRPSDRGESLLSADLRREGVISNRLGVAEFGRSGDSTFTLGDRRIHADLTAAQRLDVGRLTVRAAANWTLNSALDQPRFTPEASLACRIDNAGNAVAFASARRSVRMPSFTDLYYTVGGAQGSQALLPEEADHLEFGYRISADLASQHRLVFSQHLFHRWGHNLIDWVRFNGSSITEATNLRAVHFVGQEVSLSAQAKKETAALRHMTLSLAFLQADETSTGFESNYALDQLNHKVDWMLGVRPAKGLMLDVRWSLQDRNGGYFDPVIDAEVPFESVHLLGTTLRWNPESWPIQLHVRVDNVLDEQYVDIGNVDQPGRWIRGGITWTSAPR